MKIEKKEFIQANLTLQEAQELINILPAYVLEPINPSPWIQKQLNTVNNFIDNLRRSLK